MHEESQSNIEHVRYMSYKAKMFYCLLIWLNGCISDFCSDFSKKLSKTMQEFDLNVKKEITLGNINLVVQKHVNPFLTKTIQIKSI